MPQINWKDVIPKKFYNGDEKPPRAKTVGELITILQELPPSLKMKTGFSNCVEVHVYNISKSTRHVQIHEPD